MKYFTSKLDSWRKRIKVTGIILPMLALMITAGCVSHPAASTIQSWPTQPPKGYAMLMVYWNQGFWLQPGYGGMSVYMDNVDAFKLHIDHYTWIYVSAGQHTLSTKWGQKIFGINMLHGLDEERVMTFEDGKNYYLKLRCWEKDYYAYSRIFVSLDLVTEQSAKTQAAICWFSKPLVSQIDDVTNQPESHSSNIK